MNQSQQSSLDEFLAQLPDQWRRGEASPTHQPKANPSKTRDYSTRPDPFDGDWTTILQWLEQKPDVTAFSLLAQLIAKSPEKYDEKQLRTLQRRIGQWLHIMAVATKFCRVASFIGQEKVVQAEQVNHRWAQMTADDQHEICANLRHLRLVQEPANQAWRSQ